MLVAIKVGTIHLEGNACFTRYCVQCKLGLYLKQTEAV